MEQSALSISQTSGKVIAMNVEGIEGESQFVETDKWSDVISYSCKHPNSVSRNSPFKWRYSEDVKIK